MYIHIREGRCTSQPRILLFYKNNLTFSNLDCRFQSRICQNIPIMHVKSLKILKIRPNSPAMRQKSPSHCDCRIKWRKCCKVLQCVAVLLADLNLSFRASSRRQDHITPLTTCILDWFWLRGWLNNKGALLPYLVMVQIPHFLMELLIWEITNKISGKNRKSKSPILKCCTIITHNECRKTSSYVCQD